MQGKVSIGPASWLGWSAFVAGQIGAILTAVTGSKADLSGPGKWWSIGGIVALVATNAGRQLQAMVKAANPGLALPSDEEELAVGPESAEPRPVARESSAVPDGAEQAEPPPQG